MWYTNAKIFTPTGYIHGSFEVQGSHFVTIIPEKSDDRQAIDLCGAKVIPGLVDIHTHGNSGADFSDGDLSGLQRMARYLARQGVTSFAPTSMTLPYETLAKAFDTARELHDNRPTDCARVMGIHMEGPFFSEAKKGAQNAAYLQKPDFNAFEALQNGCRNLIRIVDVAPELEGAVQFTEQAKTLCRVSVAHTDATYNEAKMVFEAGATHITHLFNGMPPIHHRKPGIIGAGSERENVTAELICDSLHVHPSAVRMAFRLFPGRICLISDALRCCGMPEGTYSLGGQTVILKDRATRLPDGTLAGSVVSLSDCLRNAVAFGIPEVDAIQSATIVPAKEINADDEIGSIEPGKLADFIVCDDDLKPVRVFIGGEEVLLQD